MIRLAHFRCAPIILLTVKDKILGSESNTCPFCKETCRAEKYHLLVVCKFFQTDRGRLLLQYFCNYPNLIQARTGPSRRYIQGSKIAQRLPSVTYSLLQYSKIGIFLKKKFSKKLHNQKNGLSGAPKKIGSAEKNDRGELLVSPGMVCYAEKQEKPFWFRPNSAIWCNNIL